jgi:hypothetical protein
MLRLIPTQISTEITLVPNGAYIPSEVVGETIIVALERAAAQKEKVLKESTRISHLDKRTIDSSG